MLKQPEALTRKGALTWPQRGPFSAGWVEQGCGHGVWEAGNCVLWDSREGRSGVVGGQLSPKGISWEGGLSLSPIQCFWH